MMDCKEMEDRNCQSILKTHIRVDPLEDRNILLSYGLKMEEKCEEDNFDERKFILEQVKYQQQSKVTKDYSNKVSPVFTTTPENVCIMLINNNC
jgi:hypothetical protein